MNIKRIRRIFIYICGLMLLSGMHEARAIDVTSVNYTYTVPEEGEVTIRYPYVSYTRHQTYDHYSYNEYIITPKYTGCCEVTVSISGEYDNTKFIAFGFGEEPPLPQPIIRVARGDTQTFTIDLEAGTTYRLLAYHVSGVTAMLGGFDQLICSYSTSSTAAVTDTGTFRITRTGTTTASLVVYYSVGGMAVAGTDYTSIGTSATIPSGKSSVDIT